MSRVFLVLIFLTFLLKLIRDSLFYIWLWQVKEYRTDRMISHLKEDNIVGSIVPLGLWSPSAKQEISQNVNAKRLHRAIAAMEPATMFQNNLLYILTVILFLSYFIFFKNYPLIFQYLVLALFTSSFFGIIKEIKGRSLKRPKPTLKITLIFFLLAIAYFLIALCWFYSSLKITGDLLLQLKTSMLLLFVIIVNPLIISSIILAIEPVFYFQKKRIIKKATEKMRGLKKIKVIGITGSYGKTSTKEFLYAILSQKYKVAKTEGNNNTNIGVAYTVLNKVDDSYDYFICEIGAYKRGEIKEICGIVKPEIGILTGINEQHIDLFGSFENIIKAKFELIEALPEDGLAVINEKLKVKSEKLKVAVQSLKFFSLNNVKNVEVYQDYMEFEYVFADSYYCHPESRNKFGTGFVSGSIDDLDLANFNSQKSRSNRIGEYSGNRQKIPKQVRNDKGIGLVKIRLNLPGKHYIENLLSAIITAEYLGMSLKEIKAAVEEISPTEYMTRKLDGPYNSVFIDDSYSANPDGVMAALDYLAETYTGYKKIIVFPGIIELGKESEKVHKKLFERIGEICNAAYILETRNLKLGNWEIEKYPLDKEVRGIKCRFVFKKDFDKVAEMVKKDLMSSLISNPPTPLIRGANIVVLFESRGAGAVMNKLKMEKSK